eukprot:58446_1
MSYGFGNMDGGVSHTFSGVGPMRRRRKKVETFNMYIYKVLKSIDSSLGISKKAMDVINSFVFDFFHRICKEAKKLQRFCHKLSMSEKDINTSVQLILPNELAKHTISENTKAITKYQSSHSGSRSDRCGLIFPVGRIARYIKQYGYGDRIGALTAVPLASTLQYLTSELLEAAGNIANDQNKKRIDPRHVLLALQNDDDFSQLTDMVCIPDAGVKPDVEKDNDLDDENVENDGNVEHDGFNDI